MSQPSPRKTLLEKAKESSTSPGVYLMKDEKGGVLYIGKAKNVRNRISTYFRESLDSPRIELMVRQVANFDLILTETEAEALLLECTLIKKHKPRYNVRLKDDKSYPYIRIQADESFPRLEWTRRVKKDGSHYFGPFPSAWSAKQVMRLLTETFKLRDCSDNTFSHRSRPCILYQMDKCSAPCVDKIPAEDYREDVRAAIEVLQGKGDSLLKRLRFQMEQASEREEFEYAAEFRDQIQNIELITETQTMVESSQQASHDVIGIARNEQEAHGSVLQVRRGKLVSVQHFQLFNTESDFSLDSILFDFLSQYYSAQNSNDDREIIQDVMVAEAPAETDLLEKALQISLRVPESSDEKQMISVAESNAKYALEQSRKRRHGTKDHGMAAVEEVQKKLKLDQLPTRIECYDISNIQGKDAVGSRVCFIEGAPDKNHYRRYKIKTVEEANDFAMMKEVLDRRFRNLEDSLPELVVVDGGKGQLAQACAILEELDVQGVEVVGLAKARTERDFKDKDVKASPERVFLPNRKNPVILYPNTKSFQLLTHLRDEAHRFAITYHRKVRKKRTGI